MSTGTRRRIALTDQQTYRALRIDLYVFSSCTEKTYRLKRTYDNARFAVLVVSGEAGDPVYVLRPLHANYRQRPSSYLPSFFMRPAWTSARCCENAKRVAKTRGNVSEAALVHFRGDAALHFNRAIAFEKLGRFEDTEQNYKHCLELDSLYADVRRNLAIQLERDVAIHGAWSVI